MLLCRIGAHLCRRLSDRSAYFSAIAGRSRGKPVLAPGKVRSNGRLGATPAQTATRTDRLKCADSRRSGYLTQAATQSIVRVLLSASTTEK
jgi:hypothetical protein